MGDRRDFPSPGVPDLHRDRLPTLGEVLNRNTLAPVDLFSFYIYMRDIQRSVDYLDFWCASMVATTYCALANRSWAGSMLRNIPHYAAILFEGFVDRCS